MSCLPHLNIFQIIEILSWRKYRILNSLLLILNNAWGSYMHDSILKLFLKVNFLPIRTGFQFSKSWVFKPLVKCLLHLHKFLHSVAILPLLLLIFRWLLLASLIYSPSDLFCLRWSKNLLLFILDCIIYSSSHYLFLLSSSFITFFLFIGTIPYTCFERIVLIRLIIGCRLLLLLLHVLIHFYI